MTSIRQRRALRRQAAGPSTGQVRVLGRAVSRLVVDPSVPAAPVPGPVRALRNRMRRGAVIGCTYPNGCGLYPLFTLNPGASQGDVRRGSMLVPQGGELVILNGPFAVPDDFQAPIRTVSVNAYTPRVRPGGVIYHVRFTGTAIDPVTGARRSVANVEGYVNGAHVQYLRDLPGTLVVR